MLDVFRVGFADFMLAALDKPSTGTGMELIIAQDRLVPVFAFYHRDLELEKDVSRMPVGLPGIVRVGIAGSMMLMDARQKVILYNDTDDLVSALAGQILHVKPIMFAARFSGISDREPPVSTSWSRLIVSPGSS